MENRKRLWLQLSDLYLDTELQPYQLKHLAKCISESPFSYKEVREIDREEVFPLLHLNMLSVAGVWDGFDEEWLITSIQCKKEKRNFLARNYYHFMYFCMKSMFSDIWQEIEKNLEKLNTQDDI